MISQDDNKVAPHLGKNEPHELLQCEFSGEYLTNVNGVSARDNLVRLKSVLNYDDTLKYTFFQRRIEPDVCLLLNYKYLTICYEVQRISLLLILHGSRQADQVRGTECMGEDNRTFKSKTPGYFEQNLSLNTLPHKLAHLQKLT